MILMIINDINLAGVNYLMASLIMTIAITIVTSVSGTTLNVITSLLYNVPGVGPDFLLT